MREIDSGVARDVTNTFVQLHNSWTSLIIAFDFQGCQDILYHLGYRFYVRSNS